MDNELRCRFCHRYVVDGCYQRFSFPDGVANVCDDCFERRDQEEDEDIVVWRGTEVEVA